jgi:molybdenum cofactor cytidylyltransferase
MCEALGLEDPGVVAVVGSGGKTTLLQALARELAATGQKVVLTTTTHIYPPPAGLSGEPWMLGRLLPRTGELADHLRPGRPLVVAGGYTPAGKLSGLTPEQVEALAQPDVWVLVEADGAARRPLKAWAEWEPAVPSCAAWLVVVAGAAGLGRPLEERWVHRAQRFAHAAGLTLGAPITPQALARVLTGSDGPLRAWPPERPALCLLNQTDAISPRQRDELAAALHHANQGLPPHAPRYQRLLWGRLRWGKLGPL